jgi:aminoglycoside phosphotransferase (APT) family kinase protein
VVVKVYPSSQLERAAREHRLLHGLAGVGIPVPETHGGVGRIPTPAGPLWCLATTLLPGSAPCTLNGYRALGRHLAMLHRVRTAPRLTAALCQHQRSVSLRSDVDALRPVLGFKQYGQLKNLHIPEMTRGVVHGDPGPENYLYDPPNGWIIDLESTRIDATEFDLARAWCCVMLMTNNNVEAGHAIKLGYERLSGRRGLDPVWKLMAALRICGWRYENRARQSTPRWEEARALLRSLM